MIKKIIPVLLLATGFSGCKLASVSYSFTGAQISPDVKTFSVDYFRTKPRSLRIWDQILQKH